MKEKNRNSFILTYVQPLQKGLNLVNRRSMGSSFFIFFNKIHHWTPQIRSIAYDDGSAQIKENIVDEHTYSVSKHNIIK